MGTVGPQKRKRIKKVKEIDTMAAKGGEFNEDQMKKLAMKPALMDEIDKLDYYLNLYEKAQPNWNAQPEEAKVEEPVEVVVSQDLIN